VRERAERQPVAPRTRSYAGVRADHEVIIRRRLQAFDHDKVVGGIGRPVNGRWSLLMVEHLVQDYVAVTMLPRRRIPL